MDKFDERETSALLDALDDEYKSWTTYDQVIRDLGEVHPFINIREAEGRHIEALLGLFQRYGVTPPANRWLGKVARFADLHAACQASVTGEIENVAIYDRVLRSTGRPDLLAVYEALRQASRERHLPAFQRCVQRGGQPASRRRRAAAPLDAHGDDPEPVLSGKGMAGVRRERSDEALSVP